VATRNHLGGRLSRKKDASPSHKECKKGALKRKIGETWKQPSRLQFKGGGIKKKVKAQKETWNNDVLVGVCEGRWR